jgi:hypothetical protein
MPFTYAVYREHRLVISTGSGCMTWNEIKERQDQTKTEQTFNPEYDQLVDLRAVTSFELSGEQVRILARRKIFSSSSKRAFVAGNPTAFGMSRIWETLTELSDNQSHIRVFDNLSFALSWLGLRSLPESVKSERIGKDDRIA